MAIAADPLSDLVQRHRDRLLADWVREQKQLSQRLQTLLKDGEMEAQCRDFLGQLLAGLRQSNDGDVASAPYAGAREFLADVSRTRARQGFTPSETAQFVFSFKKPLFELIRGELDAITAVAQTWRAMELLDRLGLHTMEVFLQSREEVIRRQQDDMMELSTPVVKLWDGILALPLIGTLDSARTQVVMESLLQRIVETGSAVAIIDITGVPTVDTLVAQHLIKTVTAAQLMGAECIISGIRPQIAQTIVHLGVALGDVPTKATLADAFALALKKTGQSVARGSATAGRP